MQDDKLDIKKILQDNPDEVIEPVKDVKDIMADDSEDVVESVSADQDAELSDTAEPVQDVQDVMADNSEDVVESVEEIEDVMVNEVQEVVESEQEPVEPLSVEEKKERMMKILVPVLLVAFVFMAKKSFFPSLNESMAQKVQPVEAVETDTMPQWQLPQEYPSALRDPMRFGSVTGGQYDVEPESLVLKGIVFSSTPAAMINGKIVKAGDEIMGATVVEIKTESVVFRSGDQQWEQKVKR